jgi:glycosidase
MNLLGTHDTERIITVLGREDDRVGEPNSALAVARLSEDERREGIKMLKIAAALQFTAYGIPSVYYGDEVGLEGYGDPFCRMPFPWKDMVGTYRTEILEYYRMLGKMRLGEEAFDGGYFEILSHTESAIAFVREKNESKLIVIANRGDDFTLELDGQNEYRSLESGEIFTSSLCVSRDSVVILKELH